MIDTNTIAQTAQAAALAKSSLQPYLPALAIAAAWAGRELKNFNFWLVDTSEFIMKHGGIGYLLWKLIWNPPQPSSPNPAGSPATEKPFPSP